MSKTVRSWATPLVSGAFLISSVTGLLIFFEFEKGLVKPTHEWLGWLLVSGAILHVVVNRHAFAGYFSKKPAIVIFGLCTLVTLVSVMPFFGDDEHENGKRVARASVKALESSSIETIALVVKKNPDEVMASLRKEGVVVSLPSESLAGIAAVNGKSTSELLGVLIGTGAGDGDEDDH